MSTPTRREQTRPRLDNGQSTGLSVEIRGLSKSYAASLGASTTAIEDLSITMQPGTINCIIGPSGCGKTTLLNLVAGFEKASRGQLLVDGRQVDGAGSDRVVVFQDVQGSLMPWLTAQRNVEFGLKVAGVSKRERAERAREALALVGLPEARDKFVFELSGGMQQRVQIARALVLQPGILLMDEPFGALDYLTRSLLQEQLQDLHERTGATILFVTHDIGEAALLGDFVYVMGTRGQLTRCIEIVSERPRKVTDRHIVEVVEEMTDLILDPISHVPQSANRTRAQEAGAA
ncbi:ABC transporter ATP-binding protein [Georgenia yuyongxinii]|nr:ABC transporter ATP-binding protein [Georgenia yuyongxinii]